LRACYRFSVPRVHGLALGSEFRVESITGFRASLGFRGYHLAHADLLHRRAGHASGSRRAGGPARRSGAGGDDGAEGEGGGGAG